MLGINAIFVLLLWQRLKSDKESRVIQIRSIEGVNSPKNGIHVGNAGKYVGVSSKYYGFPWCSGVLRAKKANTVSFLSEKEAQKAGFKGYVGCKGLKVDKSL